MLEAAPVTPLAGPVSVPAFARAGTTAFIAALAFRIPEPQTTPELRQALADPSAGNGVAEDLIAVSI